MFEYNQTLQIKKTRFESKEKKTIAPRFPTYILQIALGRALLTSFSEGPQCTFGNGEYIMLASTVYEKENSRGAFLPSIFTNRFYNFRTS